MHDILAEISFALYVCLCNICLFVLFYTFRLMKLVIIKKAPCFKSVTTESAMGKISVLWPSMANSVYFAHQDLDSQILIAVLLLIAVETPDRGEPRSHTKTCYNTYRYSFLNFFRGHYRYLNK